MKVSDSSIIFDPFKEKPATSEVTTFTVFFMAFTAVMGKELVSVDNDSLDKLDSKSILSTYDGPKQKVNESKHIANLVDEIVMLGVDDELPQTPTKVSRQARKQAAHKFNTGSQLLKYVIAERFVLEVMVL